MGRIPGRCGVRGARGRLGVRKRIGWRVGTGSGVRVMFGSYLMFIVSGRVDCGWSILSVAAWASVALRARAHSEAVALILARKDVFIYRLV